MLTIDTQELKPLGKAEKGPQLTVYRASAGSGKTFTLATRFIELLIKNPKSYKEILAVTFTVKATAEMKERILSQLYGLSNGLPDSESYLRQILSDFEKQHISISEQELRLRAGKALQLIIHDYSNFNVETIDSFFQRILRNLARELELNANLRVELNNEDIEALAVDKLITELKDDDKVLKWIMDYINHQMADGKSWKVVDSIKEFGKKIFSDEYKKYSTAISETIHDEDFFEKYKKALKNVQTEADEKMKLAGEKFLKIINERGYIVDDFCQKYKGPAGYFYNLSKGDYIPDKKTIPNSYVKAAMESIDGWVGVNCKDAEQRQFVSDTLFQLLLDTEKERIECAKRYISAREAMKNLNELRLLNNIEQIVKEINSDANRFLLSDTQTILHNIMEGSDTPFVFEKIGGRISHIMIDEFQDTSTLQWENFKKLLLECMAHANSENLIVGDVKQSVYRWRNSDWRLLDGIENDSDLAGNNIEPVVLDKNFRSEKNIIDFNNTFFDCAQKNEIEILGEDDNKKAPIVGQIYSVDLTQQKLPVAKEPLGLVDITLLPASKNEEFNPLCVELVQKQLRALLDAKAQPKDIAILFRVNKQAILVGDSLKKEFPDQTFVSDEAFQLSSSVAVNIIVNAMKALCNEGERFFRTELASDFHVYVLRDNAEILLNKDNVKADINKWLPKEFVTQEQRLRALPLNDMAKEICLIFNLGALSAESAYVNAFFDALNAFTQMNIPNLDNFVEYWDSVMFKKTVKGGDIQGIRLMTIHKAKGLEFDHVIIPFCDWQLDKGSTLWIAPAEQPFSDMPVVPLDSKNLKETIFSDAYHEEKLQNTIDNLNLLYVAFTRAKKNLFVIGKLKTRKEKTGKIVLANSDKQYRSHLLQEIMPTIAEKLGATLTREDFDSKEDAFHFSYGSLYVKNAEKKETENIFLKEKESLQIDMSFSPLKVEFRQSNGSREFVSASDEDEADQKKHQGTIRHNVLSHIYHLSDVDRVLDRFMEEGVLADADPELNKAKIAKEIKQMVKDNKNPLVSEWFAEDAEVLNECIILSKDPQTGQVVKLRPDRVVRKGDLVTVIDFKFANPKDAYYSQVKTYMDLLRDMGQDNVKGYLWYGYTNDIEEVK